MITRPIAIAAALALAVIALAPTPAFAQIGKRFPSEKKIVPDPVTGVPLTFLTTGPSSDAKLYQTHQPWTADGKWIIFRSSDRVPGTAGQAFAVNEQTGVIVQLTEGPYSCTSALNVARKSMKLYYTRSIPIDGAASPAAPTAIEATPPATQPDTASGRGGRGPRVPTQVHMYELDLARLFADSDAQTMRPASAYERQVGMLPVNMNESGGFGLDANEDYAYIGVGGAGVGDKIPPDLKVGPLPDNVRIRGLIGGLRSINLKTGEVKHIIDTPFQMGHVQTNPFVPGEIIFCWETGGKAPQRTWTILADGTGVRPLYPEAPYEWITHEAVITRDEVAIAIMGHVTRPNPQAGALYAEAGMRTHPTGLAVVNLRTRQMRIEAQTPTGSGLWHVNGSYDGRFLVGDDFSRSVYLIDRKTSEMITLSTGHKETAADHTHPIFNPIGTEILIQSAMLAADNKALDLCVIPVPKAWLNRTYTQKAPE